MSEQQSIKVEVAPTFKRNIRTLAKKYRDDFHYCLTCPLLLVVLHTLLGQMQTRHARRHLLH